MGVTFTISVSIVCFSILPTKKFEFHNASFIIKILPKNPWATILDNHTFWFGKVRRWTLRRGMQRSELPNCARRWGFLSWTPTLYLLPKSLSTWYLSFTLWKRAPTRIAPALMVSLHTSEKRSNSNVWFYLWSSLHLPQHLQRWAGLRAALAKRITVLATLATKFSEAKELSDIQTRLRGLRSFN